MSVLAERQYAYVPHTAGATLEDDQRFGDEQEGGTPGGIVIATDDGRDPCLLAFLYAPHGEHARPVSLSELEAVYGQDGARDKSATGLEWTKFEDEQAEQLLALTGNDSRMHPHPWPEGHPHHRPPSPKARG